MGGMQRRTLVIRMEKNPSCQGQEKNGLGAKDSYIYIKRLGEPANVGGI